mmetsp:Transcript_42463/g.136214  ORF Transcript_42463/g.136214 Transcript_42463/m.136214 type:complete len:110 (-) Transcript_42463:474-803(-)
MGADKRPPGPQPTYNQGPPVAAPNQGPSAALPMLPDGNLTLGPSRRAPFHFVCSQCGQQGVTATRQEKGWGFATLAILTLGLSMLCCAGGDVHHECPSCKTQVGVSTLM